MPRWTRTLASSAAATAAAGLVVLGGAGVALADPTPGYPGGGYPGGGYPGGYNGGGGPGGGIDSTNPKPGGPVTVTATCTTGSGATLSFDGTQIATAPVSDGQAVLTGNVPAGVTGGSHTVTATCDGGQTYNFAVTVGGSTGSSGGALASTGAKVVTFAGGGLVLVVAGAGLVVLARRRTGSTA